MAIEIVFKRGCEDKGKKLLNLLLEDRIEEIPSSSILKFSYYEKPGFKQSRLEVEITPRLKEVFEIISQTYNERKRGITIEELSKKMNIHYASAAGYLSKLREAKLVRRRTNLNRKLKSRYLYEPAQ